MKRISLVLSTFLISLTAGSQTVEYTVNESAGFAIEMYKQLLADHPDNLFFSPYSITTAMGMTYTGANGETEKQIAQVFGFSDNTKKFHKSLGKLQNEILSRGSKGVQIDIANRLWADKDYKFRWGYLGKVKRAYGASIERMPFRGDPEGSRVKINNWVEQKTNDRITNLLPDGSITDLTSLVLTNAIYFKGQWNNKFDEENTVKSDFYVTPDHYMAVNMMRQRGDFKVYQDRLVQVLEMPYAGNQYSMIILLPQEQVQLYELERELTAEQLLSYTQKLTEKAVNISLPKFTFESEYKLKPTLSAMGMPLAFSNSADFTRMSKRDELKIDEVHHKAFIDVSEEGTEAAAATAVVIVRKSAMMPMDFNVNRPFMFLIRDNQSGTILFMGRVVKPN